MAIPKAYQVHGQSRKGETQKTEETTHVRFFWFLGLVIFLYIGIKILNSVERYEASPTLLASIKDSLSHVNFPRSMAYASAAPADAKPADKPADKPAEAKTEAKDQGAKKDDGEKDSEEDASKKEDVVFFDPLTITSPKEVLVFKSLGLRRQELDKREKALHQKELEISLLEKKINEKVTALEAIEKKVTEQLSILDKTEIEKAERLAKLYATMKPKEAASIIEGLDLAIVIAIASKMPEKKLAAIIALLSSDKARQLTTKISNKSSSLARHLKENIEEEKQKAK